MDPDSDSVLIAEFNDVLNYIKDEERIESYVPADDVRRKVLVEFEDWFRANGGIASCTKIRYVD